MQELRELETDALIGKLVAFDKELSVQQKLVRSHIKGILDDEKIRYNEIWTNLIWRSDTSKEWAKIVGSGRLPSASSSTSHVSSTSSTNGTKKCPDKRKADSSSTKSKKKKSRIDALFSSDSSSDEEQPLKQSVSSSTVSVIDAPSASTGNDVNQSIASRKNGRDPSFYKIPKKTVSSTAIVPVVSRPFEAMSKKSFMDTMEDRYGTER